jgi:hypothetical protein
MSGRFAGLIAGIALCACAVSGAARAESVVGERAGRARPVTMACGDDLAATLSVPAGWTENVELSERASRAVEALAGSDAGIRGQAKAFSSPLADAVLVITWATAPGSPPERAPAQARAFVTNYKQRVKRGMIGSRVVVVTASEKVHGTHAEARVEWTVKKQKLRGMTRAQAVALASTGFHGMSVQCIYLDKAEKQRRLSCETALASLVLKSPGVMMALDGVMPELPDAVPLPVSDPAVDATPVPVIDFDPGAGDTGKSGPAGD